MTGVSPRFLYASSHCKRDVASTADGVTTR